MQTNQLGSTKLSVIEKNLTSASRDTQEVKSNFEYFLLDTRLLSYLVFKIIRLDCGATNLKIVVNDEK